MKESPFEEHTRHFLDGEWGHKGTKACFDMKLKRNIDKDLLMEDGYSAGMKLTTSIQRTEFWADLNSKRESNASRISIDDCMLYLYRWKPLWEERLS